MQVSLQPTHSIANNKVNTKHTTSKSAYYNQTSQYNIHYKKWTLKTPFPTQHIKIKLHNKIYIKQIETLNTPYQTQHIKIKLHCSIYITQNKL